MGPLEIDVNINDGARIAQVSLHLFFSSQMVFMKLALSEAKGIVDIKRRIHPLELDWRGEMEGGIDFHDYQSATPSELDTFTWQVRNGAHPALELSPRAGHCLRGRN